MFWRKMKPRCDACVYIENKKAKRHWSCKSVSAVQDRRYAARTTRLIRIERAYIDKDEIEQEKVPEEASNHASKQTTKHV
jgi:hypothetical protein